MKKYKRLFLLLFIGGTMIGIPFLVYDAFYGNPIRYSLMEKATKNHLINLGYHSDDLIKVEASYSMKKDNGIKRTRAFVIFRDEPDQKYVYIQQEKNGEIQQSCSYYDPDTEAYESSHTPKRKHMVKDCVNTLFSVKE